MTLADWQRNGWLQPHATSPAEIGDLLAIAERDLFDARQSVISTDWRFGIAYNAALKLCTALLYAEGFRPAHNFHHYRALAALPLILGKEREDDADYLETCRRNRNIVEYDRVGCVSEAEADELLQFAGSLMVDVRRWIRERHPDLCPDPERGEP